MLLDEPPEEPPPPLEPPDEPEDPPEEPEEPPEEPLGMLDEDEEDCCWLAQPPIRKAETELMATQWAAIVSRRCVVGDGLGPAVEARVG